MPRLAIKLLGAPALAVDDAPVEIGNTKALALLAYLAITGTQHTRSALSVLLWPESANARTHLRVALHALRRALGAQAGRWLDDGGDTVRLVPGDACIVDVREFRQHARQVRTHAHTDGALCAACRDALAALIAGYGGDFLEDVNPAACPDFEIWLATEREQLRREYGAALGLLADDCAARHAWDDAIAYAQRGLALDPLDEAVHRKLILFYAWSDRRAVALRQYDECARILRVEFDAAPDEETEALAQAIRTGDIAEQIQPPAPPAVAMTNLPAAMTRLVGREADVQAVVGRLRRVDVRLLTLTGPGGVGKTSLALAAAAEVLPSFADGVYLVSLAPIRNPELIAETIIRTLGLREYPHLAPVDVLCQALRDKQMLLLLDNFEHVLAAAPLVADLLGACPRLNILATSREPLRLYGEAEYVVPRLESPPAAAHTLDAVVAHSAVQLFNQRARAARQDFAIDEANAAPVAQICRRLDGLPLAIELAAARLRHFTAQELLDRFGTAYAGNGEVASTLTVLRSDLRNVPERHRSLWETIAWSYDLLAPEEQRLFRRLAVFVGGWTVEAALAVCDGAAEPEIEAALWALRDKQLINRSEEADGALRFMMLETLREFGLEQLRRNDELMHVQRAMADYFVGFTEDAAQYLIGADSTLYHRLVLTEYANIRAVWTWIQEHQQAALALRLCAGLYIFSNHNPREGEQIALAALELAAGQPPSVLLVEAYMAAGYCSWLLGKLDTAEAYMHRALELDELADNPPHGGYIGVLRGMLAWRAFDRGDYALARSHFSREDELSRESSDDWRVAMNAVNWGILEWRLGEIERAHQLLDESLLLHRRVGQTWGITKALTDRADLHVVCGELDAAAALLAECPALLEGADMPDRVASYTLSCTRLALARGELDEAADYLARSFEGHNATGYFYGLEENYLCAAELALYSGRNEQATCLLAGHAAQIRGVGKVNDPLRRQKLDAQLAEARSRLDPAVADAAWARGQAMTAEDLVNYARREVIEPIRAVWRLGE